MLTELNKNHLNEENLIIFGVNVSMFFDKSDIRK